MTHFFIGTVALDQHMALLWEEYYTYDRATIDLLAEPPSTREESLRRSSTTLLSLEISGTIGDSQQGLADVYDTTHRDNFEPNPKA